MTLDIATAMRKMAEAHGPGECDDADCSLCVPGKDIAFQLKNTDRVVVFTTIATAGSPQDGATEAMLDIETRDALFARPGFPKPLTRLLVPTYRIGPAGEKGLGMFATRRLRTGALIVNERPFIVQPICRAACDACDHMSCRTIPAEQVGYTMEEREENLNLSLNRMPEERWERFLELKTSHSEHRAGSGPLLSRARTNAWHALGEYKFAGIDAQDGQYLAIFDELSRMNHSCRPNALYHWDSSTFSGSLRAVRDIEPGEEITVSYCGEVDRPYSDRRALLAPYGFGCDCRACAEGDAADIRYEQIIAEYDDLPFPLSSDKRVEQGYRYAIQRIEEEGLEAIDQYYSSHVHLTRYYRWTRDVAKAQVCEEKLNAISWAQRGKPFEPAKYEGVWPMLDGSILYHMK
ncbi:SET domain-containing protein [Schizophyllum commune H4-8]|nr:SET domain-containing protein [Schizophyllum commune H4-8]KAI5894514.1 SET domain-containing protein [Schizophyllum commune H4-8]